MLSPLWLNPGPINSQRGARVSQRYNGAPQSPQAEIAPDEGANRALAHATREASPAANGPAPDG